MRWLFDILRRSFIFSKVRSWKFNHLSLMFNPPGVNQITVKKQESEALELRVMFGGVHANRCLSLRLVA